MIRLIQFISVLLAGSACAQVQVSRDRFGGLTELSTTPGQFFRLEKFGNRDLLVTPEGHGFVALGINHISSLGRPVEDGLQVKGNEGWEAYWETVLKDRLESWHCNTIGYGGPEAYRVKLPWFGTIGIAAIEKHRSDPRLGGANAFRFPDVFDPEWAKRVENRIRAATEPHLDDAMLVGWFWTDTPTWDLYRTRALRQTDWVSEIRTLPADSPGRKSYAAFLGERYDGTGELDLDDLNEFYGLTLTSLTDLNTADFSEIAVGRHRVQEDDLAFLAVIARRFYAVVGKAQREADPNHLVFGDRYLAGDAPEFVLAAAGPWIDAVAVQPGDRYSPLYPPSTIYPEKEIELLHAVTGKPVLICDHAISFPTSDQPRTIFEQMPSEADAAQATRDFIRSAFEKPYQLGYLRCQYVDRPAGMGRGLRQGLVRADDRPRELLVRAYREGFAELIANIRVAGPLSAWTPLFDGKTLDGWQVHSGKARYEVVDGMIVGTTVSESPNTFLCTQRTYRDFELELEVKCDVGLNSGIQIRSRIAQGETEVMNLKNPDQPKTLTIPHDRVHGYQVEIATAVSGMSGGVYDEARRFVFLDEPGDKPGAKTAFKDGEWNHFRILCQGNRIRTWVNGIRCADVRDDRDSEGVIGLQVHGNVSVTGRVSKKPYEERQVRFRNLRIREIP